MQKILGISAYYHDSAAAIIVNNEIIAAAHEERFTREKHTAVFPMHAIAYCLEEAGLEIDDLDAVAFYDKPLLKFERLLETYYRYAPAGLQLFLKSMPVWLKDKLFLKREIYNGLAKVGAYKKSALKLLFSEHHMSHAASTFFVSSFQNSAIITVDGVGEWATTSIALGSDNTIELLKEVHYPHSLGLLYSAFTYFLGFRVNSGEYKLMGLAPYGDIDAIQTQKFIQKIKSEIVSIKEDGSIWLNQKYFAYSTHLRMIKTAKWEQLFSLNIRNPESEIENIHCNLALAIQKVLEEAILNLAREAKRITNSDNLCLAGGVALNCVANSKIVEQKIFKNIYVQPAAGDAGGSLGAALAVNYMYFNNTRKSSITYDSMKGAYLGPQYHKGAIEKMNRKCKARTIQYDSYDKLAAFIAAKLNEGAVVGWFQGRMEFGPRALGNRSILADARNVEMQKRLNMKIKYREGFRPFAPSVLFEDMQNYFNFHQESPYMLFTAQVKDEIKSMEPDTINHNIWSKLYQIKSSIPAVTHVDYSSRLQTVHKNTNERFWYLLQAFKKLTGCGLLVNTSFNVRGEPIVCTPEDAFNCFMNTEMDYLVINDFVYDKKCQMNWEARQKQRTFNAD